MINPDAAFSRGDLMRRMAQVETAIRQLQTARRLENATVGQGGIRVKGTGGITLQDGGGLLAEDGGDVRVIEGGNIIIEGGGDVQVLGDGTIIIQNGGMRVEQDGVIRSEDFNGDMVTGSAGSTGWALGNNQLALLGQFVTPVSFDAGFDDNDGFQITTTSTTRASFTFSTPPWATEALVAATCIGSGFNDSAEVDAMFVFAQIDGVSAPGFFSNDADPGEMAQGSHTFARVLTSPGSSILVEGRIGAGKGSWSASSTNAVGIHATAVFRRSL